jgi:mono/diheme cytochrome c family protein
MKARQAAVSLFFPIVMAAGAVVANDAGDRQVLERGRYLVVAGGCNDCHTPRYPETAGDIPASEWLTGNPVGFRGPWGTTYPANLRQVVQNMTEARWLVHVRIEKRPPMPWFNMRDMTDDDLRAMYRFIRSLGAKGAPAPAYVPPGETVKTPYIDFVPRNLPAQQASR